MTNEEWCAEHGLSGRPAEHLQSPDYTKDQPTKAKIAFWCGIAAAGILAGAVVWGVWS